MQPKSHTLFHFTKTGDSVTRILKNGFWPRYCLEDISWVGFEELTFVAFPMVCFCDIPLSRIDEHVSYYGQFGIGLTKDWAIRNGLTPVLYVRHGSELTKTITDLMQEGLNLQGGRQSKFASLFRRLHAYVKPMEGNVLVGDEPARKEFYQESEWRHIPTDKNIDEFLRKEDFQAEALREAANTKTLEACMLKFVPNDVKYIFVPTDADIPSIVNFIQNELDHFPGADQKLLMSRVISIQSIQSDL
jgi:hypothetical protein